METVPERVKQTEALNGRKKIAQASDAKASAALGNPHIRDKSSPVGAADGSETNCESMQTIYAMEVQVVYLDQNAASFLAKPNPEPIWREIREALADGFRKRKLLCPLPFEA
jgi:hypothetical protein